MNTRTFNKFEENFWLGVSAKASGCWEWVRSKTVTHGNYGGYGKLRYAGRYFLAHRVAWWLANKRAVATDEVVMHMCDNPPCVNPLHLVVGTSKENDADKVAKGRAKGRPSKLTTDQLNDIAKRLSGGESSRLIAKDYPITSRGVRYYKQRMAKQ